MQSERANFLNWELKRKISQEKISRDLEKPKILSFLTQAKLTPPQNHNYQIMCVSGRP